MKGRKPNRYMRGGFRLRENGTPVVNTRLTRARFLRGAAAGVAGAAMGLGGVARATPGDLNPYPEYIDGDDGDDVLTVHPFDWASYDGVTYSWYSDADIEIYVLEGEDIEYQDFNIVEEDEDGNYVPTPQPYPSVPLDPEDPDYENQQQRLNELRAEWKGILSTYFSHDALHIQWALDHIKADGDDPGNVQLAPGIFYPILNVPYGAVLRISERSVILNSSDPDQKPVINITAGPDNWSGIGIELFGQGTDLEDIDGNSLEGGRNVTMENLTINSNYWVGVFACHDLTMDNVDIKASADTALWMGYYGLSVESILHKEKYVDGTVNITDCTLHAAENGFDTKTHHDTYADSHVAANITLSHNTIAAGRWYGISIVGQNLAPGWAPDEPTYYCNDSYHKYTITDNTISGAYGIWCNALGSDMDFKENDIVSDHFDGTGAYGAIFTRNAPNSHILFEGNNVHNVNYYFVHAFMGSISLGMFGPTQNVTVRDNTFSSDGKVFVGISLNTFPLTGWPNWDAYPVTDCVFEGNDMSGVTSVVAQVYLGKNAQGNQFNDNIFGPVSPANVIGGGWTESIATVWIEGHDHDFIGNDYTLTELNGWYVDMSNKVVQLGSVLLDTDSYNNFVNESLFYAGSVCTQVADLTVLNANPNIVGSNIIVGINEPVIECGLQEYFKLVQKIRQSQEFNARKKILATTEPPYGDDMQELADR